MSRVKVIAISGVSGCGKTTLVRKLSDEFECPNLFFDDFVVHNTYPKNMKKWFENGARVSEIQTPKLVNALSKLISSSDSQYIFLEEPFGKGRDSISSLIDYVILLDQPMEICLSRVIQRNAYNLTPDSLNSLSRYLLNYDDHFRDIYIETAKQVRGHCNLSIKDVISVQACARLIGNWLRSNAK
ncbi:hypothetical protein A9Q74_10360 [Colwellia sp. 39_35_sub15_T18]|nr:hypothetical protein A9Q74_10360 [Colwellia sp. 39_35_sub15_T18]